MKGKCNCGRKATTEYLIRNKKSAYTIKLCKNCKPKVKYNTDNMILIDGK